MSIERPLTVPPDAELRENHEFVVAFETLRKRYGYREMTDLALQDIADRTGLAYTTLRTARHLRNALAHADPVNRTALAKSFEELGGLQPPAPATASPRPVAATPQGPLRAFRIHAWLDAALEKQLLANGFVAMGGDEIGDLSAVHDPEEIRDRLTASMKDHSPRAIALFVGYWRRFLWEAAAGDLVALPLRDRTVAVGEFVGPYHFVPAAEPHSRHRRAVSWSARVRRDTLDADLVKVLNGRHTVQEFTDPAAVERLRRLMG